MAEFVMKKMVAELQGSATLGCADNDAADNDDAGNDAAGLKCAESRAAEKNCADFEIASAATSTEEIGNPVYPPARRMLERHGIDCRGKTARQMTLRDYEYYDYIVLMDRNNLRNLRWILPPEIYERECAGGGKVSLLMDWTGNSRDVADPWYTGDFEATWNDVNEGCRAMLTSLRNGQA
jgi:protein-tyrosine phosphatase